MTGNACQRPGWRVKLRGILILLRAGVAFALALDLGCGGTDAAAELIDRRYTVTDSGIVVVPIGEITPPVGPLRRLSGAPGAHCRTSALDAYAYDHCQSARRTAA